MSNVKCFRRRRIRLWRKMSNVSGSGFTLIELIVYLAIISVVSMVSIDVLRLMSDSRGRVESRNAVNQNLRFAAERLVNDVHSATAVSAPAAAGASGNVLTLTIPGEGSVSYSVSSGVLQRNSVDITSGNITVDTANPIFARFDNGNLKTVQIKLRISYNDAGRANWQFSNAIQTTAALK